MKIIALDPGKVNFAAAVMEDRRVLETRYLDTIKSLRWAEFEGEAKAFREGYLAFLESVEPDCVLAERFMGRPGRSSGGSVGEFINIMLGIISTVNASKGIPTHLVTSAQWKNYLNSRYGRVESMKSHFPHLTVHESDALAICVYSLEQEFPEEKGKLLKYVKRLRKYPHGREPKNAV